MGILGTKLESDSESPASNCSQYVLAIVESGSLPHGYVEPLNPKSRAGGLTQTVCVLTIIVNGSASGAEVQAAGGSSHEDI